MLLEHKGVKNLQFLTPLCSGNQHQITKISNLLPSLLKPLFKQKANRFISRIISKLKCRSSKILLRPIQDATA